MKVSCKTIKLNGDNMEFKLFSDLIDALGKVVIGLKTLASIPKSERERYRKTMDETYRLVDTTLNMVIIQLGHWKGMRI